MHCGFINVILLHSDHQHISAIHVAIFRVVRASIQMHLQCIGITPQSNITVFLKFRLNGKKVMSIKYQNLKTAVCSVVLCVMYYIEGTCGGLWSR